MTGLTIEDFSKEVTDAIAAGGLKYRAKDLGKLITDIASYDCSHGSTEQINDVTRRFMFSLTGDNVDNVVRQNLVIKLIRDNFVSMLPAI